MAPRQEKRNVAEVRRQIAVLKDQGEQLCSLPAHSDLPLIGKQPQGIRKKRPQISTRRSDRLKDKNTEQKPSPTNNSRGKQACYSNQSLSAPLQAKDRKRKRSKESDDPLVYAPAKRLQTSVAGSVVEATSGVTDNRTNPIDYWRKHGRWPKEYFELDNRAREDFKKDFEKDSWYEKYWIPEMNHLLAKKKSSSSLRAKQSEAGSATPSSTTPSDQKPREIKSIPYTRPSYETVLATKGSFMGKSDLGITDVSKGLCRNLLEAEQSVPQDTLFRDDLFDETCESVRARNEAMVVRDISPLLCPSAQSLRIYGAKHLKPLIESVSEGWNCSIPFYGPRPQPDYSVGFGRSAFTDDQLQKLKPFIGEVPDGSTSHFMATWQMYFPFLTCEVKCGAAALDVADRQNAHSATLELRGIVELFRLVKRDKELHREILAFSISHDHSSVRIYSHYPVIDGPKTTFYRYPIKKFDFTSEDGKEKWTAYKFTKNVYDIWMPMHFKRICSVIDELPPDINFNISELQSSEASGLSQVFEEQSLSQQSNPDTTSLAGNDDDQSSLAGSITSNTSLSHGTDLGVFKKPKKRRTVD
jgi:hypothetical protein